MRSTQLQINALTSVRSREYSAQTQLQIGINCLKRVLCRHYEFVVEQQVKALEDRLATQIKVVQGVQDQLNKAFEAMIDLRKERESLIKPKGKRRTAGCR